MCMNTVLCNDIAHHEIRLLLGKIFNISRRVDDMLSSIRVCTRRSIPLPLSKEKSYKVVDMPISLEFIPEPSNGLSPGSYTRNGCLIQILSFARVSDEDAYIEKPEWHDGRD